jgi:regulator of chromosome condensation
MHGVALGHDSQIYTWGVNDQGALGRDTTWAGGLRDVDTAESDSDSDAESDSGLNPIESVPTAIPSARFPPDTKFVQVAAGDSCTFALTTTGLVYGWGTFRVSTTASNFQFNANILQDSNGVFGFTLNPQKEIVLVQRQPMLVRGLSKITSISVGADFALALDIDGNVFAWGNGQQDQLGRRLIERRRSESLLPTRIALPKKKIVSIHAGSNHAFAIDTEGNTWAWGSNNFAQTGIVDHAGEGGNTVTGPRKVASLSGRKMRQIQGGSHHSIGVAHSGECLVWGRLDGSQMGIDMSTLPVDDPTKVTVDARMRPRILLQPTAIPNLHCSYAAAGSDHNIAVATDGTAYSWGFNANYQCGQGNIEDIATATLINNTATRGRMLVWAGAGGQFSVVAAAETVDEGTG